MYGEALRNWGAFLLFLALVCGAAGTVIWIAAGRWLRAQLEAEYGKVCALPREAWITQEAAEQKEAAEQESEGQTAGGRGSGEAEGGGQKAGEEDAGARNSGEWEAGEQEPETPRWTQERQDAEEQTPDQR